MITRENIEYWNNRVKKYGHTGWSDSIIYAYDQKAPEQLKWKIWK